MTKRGIAGSKEDKQRTRIRDDSRQSEENLPGNDGTKQQEASGFSVKETNNR